MARAYGSRAQMAVAWESTYGTAPASGFIAMPFAETGLGAAQPLLESELLGQGRDPLPPTRDAVTVDGDVTIPICARNFGFWLKGAFGQPTSTGSDPYTHVYQTGGYTLPSMSIEVGMPEVPTFAMYSGVRVDRLNWTMQRSGLLTAAAALVAQGENRAGATAAGTPSVLDLQRFGHFNGSVTRDGTPLGNVVSAEVSYSNNLDRIETIRADGLIDGADPTMAALTGRIDVRFADTTLLTQATSGAPCELVFRWELSANVHLQLAAHAVYLPLTRTPISGAGGVQVQFDWQAARAASPARMATVTLVNDVESY